MKLSKLILMMSSIAWTAAGAQDTRPAQAPDPVVQLPGSSVVEPGSQPAETEKDPEWQDSAPESSGASVNRNEKSTSQPASATAPQARSEKGFTYLCGGVGESEAEHIKQLARDYDVMMTFATEKGEYLADVKVQVTGTNKDATLETLCEGPLMLINFPEAGTYRIHAESGGFTLEQAVRVAPRQPQTHAMVLHWPHQIGEQVETGRTSVGNSGAAGEVQSGTNNGTGPILPAGSTPQQ